MLCSAQHARIMHLNQIVLSSCQKTPRTSVVSMIFFFSGVGVGGWQYYRTVPLNVVHMEAI